MYGYSYTDMYNVSCYRCCCCQSGRLCSTIRHSKCDLLLNSKSPSNRCSFCESHRKVLHVMLSRQNKTPPQLKTAHDSHVNYRYLTTPEKDQRLRELHSSQARTKARLTRLSLKLQEAVESTGVLVNDVVHDDLKQILNVNDSNVTETLPADSFQRIFWEKATILNNSRSMRWHPLMIRWCLYLK